MPWQKTFALPERGKGCHLVQREVLQACEEGLRSIDIGIFTLCCLHTSAGLTINENFDPWASVMSRADMAGPSGAVNYMSPPNGPRDMDMALDRIVPENFPWEHTDEGPDDSVSHLKTSLIGNSVTIPIRQGMLVLGTWQSIYLCEFRESGGFGQNGQGRKVVATILP